MKGLLGIRKDKDIQYHEPISTAVCEAFKGNNHPGPDLDNLQLDFTHPLTCEWNTQATTLLLGLYRETEAKQRWNVRPRGDEWVKGLIEERMGRL